MKTLTKTWVAALAATILLSTSTTPAAAGDLKDASEIVNRTNAAQYYAGKDGRALVRMKIVDGKGRSQRRQFAVLRRDVTDGGDQNYLVVFDQPADVRNTTFLVKKHAKKDDDRWLYLPGLDLVKRIAASDERTSFVGTHFFYEDISGRHPDEDKHQLVETTDTEYVVKSTPKSTNGVEFAYYTLWINKKTFLPSKIEYVNAQGKVYRRIETAKVDTLQGFPTITRLKVSDLESGGYTLSDVSDVKYDLGIPDDIFVETSLRNPPQKWLR
ncbi:MAG: outer membrane lipoprotein-sorting protein [Myxococcales bacterium]|nr:outer membrane lipoprotein-sorting protein [Myxococcales bacterium]